MLSAIREMVRAMKHRILENLKKLNRLQKAGLTVVCILVIYTIIGFLILPSVVKHLMQKNLSSRLHRQVTIEKVYVNPFVLSLEVDGFSVKAKSSSDDEFASFKRLYVNLQSMSVFLLAPVIKEINLEDPYLKIIRIDEKSFNFSDLFSNQPSKEEEEKEPSSPVRFSVRDVKLHGGTLEIVDRSRDTKHLIHDIDFSLPEINSMKGAGGDQIKPSLTATINDSPVSLSGEVKLFANADSVSATVKAENINLPYYSAYLPAQLKLKVLSGQLNVKTQISYTQSGRQGDAIKLSGDLALNGFKAVSPQGKDLLGLDSFAVSVAEFDPFGRRLHISKVALSSPSLGVSRDNNGRLNLAELYVPSQEEPSTNKESTEQNPFSVTVDELQVTDGKIDFSDQVPPGSFKTTLFPVDLSVTNFSSVPKSKAGYSLTAGSDKGESVSVSGTFSNDPLVSSGRLEFSKILIPKYAPYFKNQLQFDIRNSTLDFAADFHYGEGGNGPWIKLKNIASAVHSLQLRMQNASEDFMDIGVFTVNGAEMDLAQKRLSIDEISSQHGLIKVIRDEDGRLNYQKLLPESNSQEDPQAEPKTAKGGSSWQITLKHAKMDDYSVKVEDLKTAQPTSITADKLHLDVRDFSSTPGNESQVALSFLFNNKGKVSIDGKVKIKPVYANLKANIENVEIASVEPYYHDYVKVYVTGGNLSANGNAILDLADPSQTKISYLGDFAITDFTSLPKVEGQEIVKWQRFALEGIDTGNTPPHLKITKVDLVGFTSFIRVNPDGTINFRQVLKTKEEMPKMTAAESTKEVQPASESVSSQPAGDVHQKTTQLTQEAAQQSPEGVRNIVIEVGQIALQDSVIDFTDSLIEPNFHASFYGATGSINGLSSQPGTSADVQIKAKVDEYAPAEISGKFNPLTKDLFVDLTLKADNIDMTISNPYAQKFAGYHVEKGKLSFNFQYKIDHGNLDAHHHVEFDNLTLGDKVDSPDATKLPLKFALSLLQDRNGDITLDVPVTGEINNPKFDFSQVIKTAISNIFKKIITAPFALLGAMFGGGNEQDLNYVTFKAGSAEITPDAGNKLEVLAKALYERPKLELEAAGYVDKKSDTQAIAEKMVQEQQPVRKNGETVKGEAGQTEATGGSTNKGQGRSKKAAARQKTSPTGAQKTAAEPPTGKGSPKQAAPQVKVSTEQLKDLARRRATNVRDYIIKSGNIDPKRIYIVSPQSLQPKEKKIPSNSSVILSLK